MTRQPRRFVGHFYRVFKGQAQFGARGQCAADFPRTAEIVGHTVTWNRTKHYALANIALVGEAILLAMRTNVN